MKHTIMLSLCHTKAVLTRVDHPKNQWSITVSTIFPKISPRWYFFYAYNEWTEGRTKSPFISYKRPSFKSHNEHFLLDYMSQPFPISCSIHSIWKLQCRYMTLVIVFYTQFDRYDFGHDTLYFSIYLIHLIFEHIWDV